MNRINNFFNGYAKVIIQFIGRAGSTETIHADNIAVKADIAFPTKFSGGFNGNARRCTENFFLVG